MGVMNRNRITQPGVYNDVSAKHYHADPCPVPSLSSGVARLMMRSPMHAANAHPRLNPDYQPREVSEAMVNGTILHSLILEAGANICTLDFLDFKTKDARAARDEATARGETPVLRHKLERLRKCAKVVIEQMRDHPLCKEFFESGTSEAVAVWREGPAWLRIMVDRMPNGKRMPWFDLKSTGGSAAPDVWQSALIKLYAFQSAFYLRGGMALGFEPAEFRFVVFEVEPPHAMSVLIAAPSLSAIAEAQVERAVSDWKRCQRDGVWPGYPKLGAYVEAPSWLSAQEENRAFLDEQIEEFD